MEKTIKIDPETPNAERIYYCWEGRDKRTYCLLHPGFVNSISGLGSFSAGSPDEFAEMAASIVPDPEFEPNEEGAAA